MARPHDTARVGTSYGLLGRTLGHSYSPAIHARLGSVPYDLIELEPDELSGFVRNGSWKGLNVTIPYKRDVVALADELSPAVRRLGAANTLVRREDGSVLADNTDLYGFASLLERFATRSLGAASARDALAGREVLVLGSGGASRAVCAALGDVGALVSVISRSGDDTYAGLAGRHPRASLVVNATPVGMYPHCPASPLAEETLRALPGLVGVLDVVYNPARTGILLEAERLGIPGDNGLRMLVAQAKRSSELFRSTTIDDALVDAIESSLRASMGNVVLIGMPGVGKTGTGKSLAHQTGRPFIDLDAAMELEYGSSPARIITERGEPAFRALETEVIRSYGMRSGLVIACGGGCVTRKENYDLLHQNGTLVMLDRPVETLSTRGRPLSVERGVEALARERLPLLRRWADMVFRCTGSPAGDALGVARELGL